VTNLTKNSALTAFLGDLTKPQKVAAEWNDGPFLLLAGPGSGKTRVLTARIARLLLESDEENFRIVALTFTNRAADEMRARISSLASGLEQRLFVGTFHSFAADILRQDGIHIEIKSDFKIYSDEVERQDLLNLALANLDRSKSLRIEPSKLLPIIDRLRSLLVPPDKAAERFKDHAAGLYIADAYRSYEETLITQSALDYAGLIYCAYQLFEKFPTISTKYQRIYKYWCVDEFQDTNNSQFLFIKKIISNSKNIFAVADDDQIIFQWNGASHERVSQFSKEFEPTVLQLPTNFRCPPEVVGLANSLIQYNSLRTAGKEPLVAAKPDTGKRDDVRMVKYQTEDDEANGIAQDVKVRVSRNEGDIAILARTRKILERVLGALRRENVPSRIVQRRDEFQSSPFIWLNAVLVQSNTRSDVRNFEKLVGAFNNLVRSEVSAVDLMAEAKASHGDFLRLWCDSLTESDRLEISLVGARVKELLVAKSDYVEFCEWALAWFSKLKLDAVDNEELYAAFGEDRDAWVSLETEIRSSIGIAQNLEAFLLELSLRSKDAPVRRGEVALMTIHAAKGSEFDIVYLAGLADDVLPSFQAKKAGPQSVEMEEERRNCFVAITRTKKRLILTFSTNYRGWDKAPSRFLFEMGLLKPTPKLHAQS